MFDEVDEITFDSNKQIVNGEEKLPSAIQQSVNTIVNRDTSMIKNDTKEMLKGAVLGGLLGVILCLYRKKNVWLGILAGGLAGGYLAREGILNFPTKKHEKTGKIGTDFKNE